MVYTEVIRLCAYYLRRDHVSLVYEVESHQNFILFGAVYTFCVSVSSVCWFVHSELIWTTADYDFPCDRSIASKRPYGDLSSDVSCASMWAVNKRNFNVNEQVEKGLRVSDFYLQKVSCIPVTRVSDNLSRLAALLVRTWAVWHQNRYVGGGLAIMWVITLAISCYVTSDFVKSLVSKWFIRMSSFRI
jgi:hypothetical protein